MIVLVNAGITALYVYLAGIFIRVAVKYGRAVTTAITVVLVTLPLFLIWVSSRACLGEPRTVVLTNSRGEEYERVFPVCDDALAAFHGTLQFFFAPLAVILIIRHVVIAVRERPAETSKGPWG